MPAPPRRPVVPWGVALLLAALLAGAPRPARAGTEEFSTFDVVATELDDESLLDHLLTRPPREWRDEWERSVQAFRSSQGCLTSGEWFLDNDLKFRAPMGARARFGIDLRQSESDEAAYDYVDFSFHFPVRAGVLGVMFRPLHDKSRQDLGLQWEAGADTAANLARVAFVFEDVFNNLWAFRQTQVGQKSEPYEKHPFEPALALSSRHERWRAQISGQYLTPSTKRLYGASPGDPDLHHDLWGALAQASVEGRTLGATGEARAAVKQAASGDRPVDGSIGDLSFRRMWSVEAAVRREVYRRIELEARVLYQGRTEDDHAPLDSVAFDAIDRVLQLDGRWRIAERFAARFGALYDRITVAQNGLSRLETYGTRNESRAYLGVVARFGRVSVHVIEGFEFDPEPYEVWKLVRLGRVGIGHDKGFFHLQTTF